MTKRSTYISPEAFGKMENKPVRVMTMSRKEFMGTLKLEWWDDSEEVKSVTIVKPNNTLVVLDKETIEWIEEI